MHKKIVVVGAGFSGLAAAALLARQGYQVKVLEKNSSLGGRARVWKKDGFLFDMGPSWYLMPEVFEHFFGLFGRRSTDFYQLKKLDPLYKIWFENEGLVEVPTDPREIEKLFMSIEPGAAERLRSYLHNAGYKYHVALQDFLYRSYSSIFDFFSFRLISRGLKLRMFSSLHSYVRQYFSDHRLQKILEYAMVFLGNSPQNAPALYSIMSHMDLQSGVWYPLGGMGKIVEALLKLCQEYDVEVINSAEVVEFGLEKDRISSCQTANKTYELDLLLWAGDYPYCELQLLPPAYRSYDFQWWQRKVYAPSMFILYLGLNKKIPLLTHHNLYFSHNWDRHFQTIFENPAWPENPCFYLCAPSVSDSSVAPVDKENLFLLVPIAPGIEEDEEQRLRYAEYVLGHLEKVIGEPLRDSILFQRIFSLKDFRDDYNAYRSTALGMAHTLWQTAVFRPAHRSRKLKNLFYCGQYTHPGVGVPMVLIAAEVVARLIAESLA